jgi:hypothetical protein
VCLIISASHESRPNHVSCALFPDSSQLCFRRFMPVSRRHGSGFQHGKAILFLADGLEVKKGSGCGEHRRRQDLNGDVNRWCSCCYFQIIDAPAVEGGEERSLSVLQSCEDTTIFSNLSECVHLLFGYHVRYGGTCKVVWCYCLPLSAGGTGGGATLLTNSPMLACHEDPTAPKLWDGGSSLSMVRAPCVFLRASVLIRARLFLRLKICRPMKDALVPSYQRRVAHGASSPSRSSLKRHGQWHRQG